MGIKVRTYTNPNNWINRKDVVELEAGVHICATGSMRRGITETYKTFEREARTIAELKKPLFPGWFSQERRLQLQLEASVLLDSSKDIFNGGHYGFVRKNIKDLLETILDLRFVGVSHMHFNLENLDGKEIAFVKFWENCVSMCSIYKQMCCSLDRRLGDSSGTCKTLKKHFDIDITKDMLILQGFYFITPEQQIILKCLEESGADMMFFNLYDDRFEKTFGFVRNFICDEMGWTSNWEMESMVGYSGSGDGTRFLDLFEDEKTERILPPNNSLIEYPDFNVFMQNVLMPALEKDDDGPVIVSTSADILNSILSNYFPDRYASITNYLKYPIGQFIMNIHRISNVDEGKMDFGMLVDLFASGFLQDEEHDDNANDYIGKLYDLREYCADCNTLLKWEQRLNHLKGFNTSVIPLFEEDGSRIGLSSGNPFKRLSHGNVTFAEIESIQRHITKISKIYGYLFDGGTRTRLDNHFDKVRKTIENLTKGKDVSEEDLKIIGQLSKSLAGIDSDVSCLYRDISDALTYYMSGKAIDDDNPPIIPFIEVDGLAFSRCVSGYHVTGLDEGGLPLGEYDMPYPLSEKTVRELSNQTRELGLLIMRNESVKCISRYLIFIVLEFMDPLTLELSWIRNFADKENLDKSIYMSLLGIKEKKIPIVYKELEDLGRQDDTSELPKNIRFDMFSDFKAEYKYCERRFLYGYLLSNHNYYRDELPQRFIFGEITKLVNVFSDSQEETIMTVSEAFPQWDDTSKMMDGIESIRYTNYNPDYTLFKDIRLDDRRLRMIFPGIKATRLKSIAVNDPETDIRILKSLHTDSFMRTNTDSCHFCPESWHCPLCSWEAEVREDE